MVCTGDVMDPPHSIIVCANGTWCGKVAGTVTNVQILANSFAGTVVQSGVAAHNAITNTTVCFFDGVGLTGTFSEYLVDGALALDIENRCVDAYLSIVQHYNPGSRISVFGHSRGAYTVRCVAGMIHKCGILRRDIVNVADLRTMCSEVYAIYRSTDPSYSPDFFHQFKAAKSHVTEVPPIRFMGLLDTVGEGPVLLLLCNVVPDLAGTRSS